MVIELNIARRVVSELHDAIRQPINLMDENGRIIASTDASRIGTVHSAACQAIRENMECLVVRADGEYAGSRIGVNVPLRFDGKIVGVVGITGGNYEELSRYVHLIRTTTEALLRVQAGRAEETNAERRVQALWEDVLFRPDEPSPSALRALAQFCALEPSDTFGAAVIKPTCVGSSAPASWQEAVRSMAGHMGSALPLYCAPDHAALFFREASAELLGQLDALAALREGSTAFSVGFTRQKNELSALRQGFRRAQTACRVARLRSARCAVCYDNLTLELLLPDLAPQTCRDYLDQLFAGQGGEALRRWRTLLTVFFASDGSVTKTAEQLFVHKNTVQYQLRKIAEATGFDPRRMDHAAIFQMALLLIPDEP